MSSILRPGWIPKVVVATTVALSFISFWRGAAIVLGDLASSAYYAGGIAERAVGTSAPWFILGAMLFTFAVRSVYMESCSMFVRGGVYVVVRDSMGPFVARLSVSSLVFDYILTGPISSVTAGQYLGRLLNELSMMLFHQHIVNPDSNPEYFNYFAAFFGVCVTIYYWWYNTKGIQESSTKALRVLQIMTVMVAVLLIWCPLTLILRGNVHLPPAPTPANLHFSGDALGWWKGTRFLGIPFVVVMIAFGHAVLSMSGFETLAQVYREIAYPKMKNVKITANIICFYALISTGLITVFAGMIITEHRERFYDNLIGGLAMNLAGPEGLKLVFQTFVVIVGVLILSGGVNTSIIGASAVLNRVAEDGVLLDWFRKPHRRFGTTFRIINTVTALQLITIVLSRGNVYLLGEAYAFGVVWSFLLKSIGVLVLRYQRHDQEYKFPFNLRIRGVEIPIGLGCTTLVLALVAIANLFSKQIATISGLAFTVVLFVVFTISERINARKHKHADGLLEKFNLETHPKVDAETIRARPGCVLVAARDYNRLLHLQQVLGKTNLRRHDVVVMTVRPVLTRAGEYELSEDQYFGDYEQELFSRVVQIAEKEGKPVELLVVPGVDPFDALVQTAAKLQASRLVTGVSAQMDSEELARRIGLAWERLPEPRHPFSLEVISPGRPSVYVNLGPHPPRLWPEDVGRLHELWLALSEREGLGSKLHHRDVVGLALRRLEKELSSEERQQIIEDLKRELRM
ncbi:MAG: APC family permease [Bryobacteraceae bacterium]|jgi:amino acid transporter/nucleotide-binding universal stress UspA family protein